MSEFISRKFQKIVVSYPSICPYPEYEGKPYFAIQFIENGKDEIVGFGTYNPNVLSQYLKEYFLSEPERKHGEWKQYYWGNEQCSVCGAFFPVSEFKMRPFDINYCPNCGADMRGDHE